MGYYFLLFCLKNLIKNYMIFICVILLIVVWGLNFDICKIVGNFV